MFYIDLNDVAISIVLSTLHWNKLLCPTKTVLLSLVVPEFAAFLLTDYSETNTIYSVV